MTPEQWQRITAVFSEVADEPLDRRAARVRALCDGDEALYREVMSLLTAHDSTSTPLDAVAPGVRAVPLTADYAGRRFGAYRILREIGRGGMGAVFLAERADGEFHRQVALKIVGRTFAGEEMLRRFRRERQIHATLSHPHIAHLLDGGVSDNGEPFFVMEYVDGLPIDRYCATAGLALPQRLALVVDVCRAVAHAHEQQVIHRDLKPSNILVTTAGVPKLLDFGIARVLDDGAAADLTLTEYRAFTPEYASPEQVRGERGLTPATDVYSLGVLLTSLIGEAPPMALRRIAAMACRPEPGRRYATAAELGDDIARYLRDEPVSARPDSVSYRVRTLLAERRGQAIAAALVVVALLAGAVGARYVAGARVDGGPVAANASTLVPASGTSVRSLAVLPLASATASTTDRALRVGMADAVAARLGQMALLTVRPTSTTVDYLDRAYDAAEVGRRLRVDAVLHGSLHRVGSQLHTTMRLVEVASGRVIWTQQLTTELAHLLRGASSFSYRVSAAVGERLALPRQPVPGAVGDVNVDAQDAYLRGTLALATAMRDVGNIFTARDAFELAIRRDPNFGFAHSALANTYTLAGSLTILAPQDAYPRAERAARRALDLDPDMVSALVAIGEVEADYNWNWAAAEASFRRALALAPNSSHVNQIYAEFLARQGRFAEAAVHTSRAAEQDPTRVNYIAVRALHYYLEHRFDDAIAEARKAIAIDPQTYLAYLYLSMAHAAKGDYDAGLEAARQATALTGGAPSDLFVAACNYALMNDRPTAEATLARLQAQGRTRYIDPFIYVAIHAFLGDTDRAFEWLERSYVERSYWMTGIRVQPVVDSLRGDPRFAEMLRRMQLD
jgi:tetratricopeptide (TPR) repeat protein